MQRQSVGIILLELRTHGAAQFVQRVHDLEPSTTLSRSS